LNQEKIESSDVNSAAQQSLSRSREEIKVLTKSILDLANARQKVSLQVARDKAILGEQIFNLEVEEKLLSESDEYARKIGLDQDLAQALVQDLIKHSKVAQSSDLYREKIKQFLEVRKIKTIAIVGAGRMGSWFARYFRGFPVKISLYDEIPGKAKGKARKVGVDHLQSIEEATGADLVVVSVPISKTPAIVRQLSELALDSPKDLILLEISSVKKVMEDSGLFGDDALTENIKLYSIHPLFGGSAQFFEANSIIQSFPKDTTFLRGIFPQCAIFTLDWSAHDELMGLFLTLPHALAMVFADVIDSDGRKLSREILSLNSPSYLHMLDLAQRVLSEDPEIYFEIQSSNPNSKLVISRAMNSLLKLEKSINSRSEFVEFFLKARRRIDAIEKTD